MICQDEQRRHEVRRQGLNGIDFIEVSTTDRRILHVYFLGKAPFGIKPENVRITGGARITGITVRKVELCLSRDPERDDCLIVTVDRAGDFSTYTLCLVALDEAGRPTEKPFPALDPRFTCADFSFVQGCPSDLDCLEQPVCPPEIGPEPQISYIAKDYASFRKLILDRLALVIPEWQDEHVPDLGITLVELLAYMGDQLSYYQDAVATEAYLDTARQRISVRRHGRLVDYSMHEGCNARAWLALTTAQDRSLEPRDTAFVALTDQTHFDPGQVLSWQDLSEVPADQYEVFEPLVADPLNPLHLYKAHNEIRIYTWGDRQCCLPKGAVSADLVDGDAAHVVGHQTDADADQPQAQEAPTDDTLSDKPSGGVWRYRRALNLQAGDMLIFEEKLGPETGHAADADPNRRHAVRLTHVEPHVDELFHQPLLKVFWSPEDALPFPICLSAIVPQQKCALLTDISVALGNVILADHGRCIGPEDLGCAPADSLAQPCDSQDQPGYKVPVPGSFAPILARPSLTFSEATTTNAPATDMLRQDPRSANPWIRLVSFSDPDCGKTTDTTEERITVGGCGPALQRLEDGSGDIVHWQVRRDLLDSLPNDRDFVVEMNDERIAHLRFGNGEMGRRADARLRFQAVYRVGNGPVGNVGAESITHVVFTHLDNGSGLSVRNPMPARGGIAPEPVADVKLMAPHAVRRELHRAVTPDDYAAIVMRDFPDQVQRAAAAQRWMGSWYEVMVAVDPWNALEAGEDLLNRIEVHLNDFRRINHCLNVVSARQVPIELTLDVCVAPDYLCGHIKTALLEVFSNRRFPDGRLGFFHPDNLSFGQGICTSSIIAAAQSQPGVVNAIGRGDLPRL